MRYIFFFLLAGPAFSKTTPDLMQGALKAMVTLITHSSSQTKFTDPASEKLIDAQLDSLLVNMKQIKHSKEVKRSTLEPSYQTLIQQVEDAKLQFSAGNKHFARIKINQVNYLCLSCHTQFPAERAKTTMTNYKLIDSLFKDEPLDKGNIQLILRDYNDALASYKKVISHKLQAKLKGSVPKVIAISNKPLFDKALFQAFFNSVLIMTKVESNPRKALDFLAQINSEYELPTYVSVEVSSWKTQLKRWIGNPDLEKKLKALKESTVLDGDHDIDLMMISGKLSKKSYHSPDKLKENDLLYWMAMAEYRLGKNIFYSLGDIYLKKCIETYRKSKAGRECFKAYEEEIIFRHTGSSGTSLPPKAQSELERLRSLI